ncbi:MAG: superoxide dismutase [Ferruginibacter sp.]|nr:superoxide dismutase [Ferruginibacter sp.]
MNNQNLNRRKFIGSGIKGMVVAGLSVSAAAEILSSCNTSKKIITLPKGLSFDQKPLPYPYHALEDVIDSQTMEIHYTKHAAAYSKNLKEAASAENVASNTSVESLLGRISKYSMKMRNNAGGHYNHEMFWNMMRPKRQGNMPSGELALEIEKHFGSFESFKLQFSNAAAGRFGSGWAWLYVAPGNVLKIGSTPNQDNPLMDISTIKGSPLLGLDVWEHAYYLKYQNKRADYIANWWSIVNWDFVNSLWQKAI